jgi:hypothetical protein
MVRGGNWGRNISLKSPFDRKGRAIGLPQPLRPAGLMNFLSVTGCCMVSAQEGGAESSATLFVDGGVTLFAGFSTGG